MPKRLTIITTTYKAEKYLENYFEHVLALKGLASFIFRLVMNEPTAAEIRIAKRYKELHPDVFEILEVPARESIGSSMNRGFLEVETPYCSILDVDDIRLEESFFNQIECLEGNPHADFTYGDIITEAPNGDKAYIKARDFDVYEFQRGCHASPTQLFRTSLLKKIGGFDEQLWSGGDFDFNVRAAFNCAFVKTDGILCRYTLNAGSASRNILQPIERTVVELRYGSYDRTRELKGYMYVGRAKKYNLGNILLFGEWKPLSDFVPGYEWMMKKKTGDREEFERSLRRELLIHYVGYPFVSASGIVSRATRSLGRIARGEKNARRKDEA